MRKILYILLVFMLVISLTAKDYRINASPDFNMGVFFRAGSSEIIFTDTDNQSELAFLLTGLRVDFDLNEYMNFGLIAGYQQNHFNDIIESIKLPLSLSFPEENSNSMFFGLTLETEPFSYNDFVINFNFEVDYFKALLKSYEIKLPIAEGISEFKNSFFTGRLSILFKYEGFASFTPFIGPNINVLFGNLTISENIEELEGTDKMKYKQGKIFGLKSGVKFELGESLDIEIDLNLFSEKSLFFSILYIF